MNFYRDSQESFRAGWNEPVKLGDYQDQHPPKKATAELYPHLVNLRELDAMTLSALQYVLNVGLGQLDSRNQQYRNIQAILGQVVDQLAKVGG